MHKVLTIGVHIYDFDTIDVTAKCEVCSIFHLLNAIKYDPSKFFDRLSIFIVIWQMKRLFMSSCLMAIPYNWTIYNFYFPCYKHSKWKIATTIVHPINFAS